LSENVSLALSSRFARFFLIWLKGFNLLLFVVLSSRACLNGLTDRQIAYPLSVSLDGFLPGFRELTHDFVNRLLAR